MDKMIQREVRNNEALKASTMKDDNLKEFVAQKKVYNNFERHPILQSRDMFLGNLFGKNSDGEDKIDFEEKIDYDLKRNGEDGLHEAESSDFEEWWGVERDQGKSTDSHDSDDDEPHGGVQQPVFDF